MIKLFYFIHNCFIPTEVRKEHLLALSHDLATLFLLLEFHDPFNRENIIVLSLLLDRNNVLESQFSRHTIQICSTSSSYWHIYILKRHSSMHICPVPGTVGGSHRWAAHGTPLFPSPIGWLSVVIRLLYKRQNWLGPVWKKKPGRMNLLWHLPKQRTVWVPLVPAALRKEGSERSSNKWKLLVPHIYRML